MKRFNFIVIACLMAFVARAQISSGEYFFDTDPGIGNATTLTLSGNQVDQDFNIPTTGLTEGVHKLYIRVLGNSGDWTLYDKKVFYVSASNSNNANIASAEYFLDTDPGVGNGTSLAVTGNIMDQNFNIPTTGLSNGVHKLYVRLINDDGTWSLYDKNVIYISPNNSNAANIASAEYFIDTDPGVGNGTSLTVSGNLIDQDFDIPTTGLSDGVHKLYVRLVNGDGTWSLYDKNVFYLSSKNSNSALITAAEYFFDIDPGIGNASSIDLDDVENLDENLVVQTPVDLSGGDHFLYIRVQNTNGTWSLYAPAEATAPLSVSTVELEQFKFYPNPVKNVLHLDVQNQNITDFKVIDLNGRVVIDELPENFKVDLNRLNSGTYLFQLKTDIGRVSKKFIKE